MHISAAEHVIKQFGGIRPTARALKCGVTSVARWKRPRSKDGTAGSIPEPYMRTIMEIAYQKKLDITANDLVFGRNLKKPR